MTTSIALFNNKGGVGKTTLTVNVARAFGQLGYKTLIVDADPQCNSTAFYLPEEEVDRLLDDSIDPEEGGTIWSGIAKHVRGRGEVRAVSVYEVDENTMLLPGDVLLGAFEDRLSAAWKDSFSKDPTSIDLMSAIHRCVSLTAKAQAADIILYDVGPSVGSLNRALLLGCDYFSVPVGCDLFSLRALGTLGQSLQKWIVEWDTVRTLAKDVDDVTLLSGTPRFAGYITQHFNIYRGRSSSAFEEWEKKIAPRIVKNVVEPMQKISTDFIPTFKHNKLGAVPAFHSLAPLSQKLGIPIGGLRGHSDVNNGYTVKIDEADAIFLVIAKELAKRVCISKSDSD